MDAMVSQDDRTAFLSSKTSSLYRSENLFEFSDEDEECGGFGHNLATATAAAIRCIRELKKGKHSL
jgi:hypothetical protein